MGSYGLLDFVFVFRSTSKVSWSLIESHWVSWFNDCQSWGVGAIFEHLRVWSTPCVLAPCWVGSSSLGHPRHAYVTVVWSCAVPMCRLCCLRCAFEWNGRRMSTACALLKHWRCGQVEVATVYGPVWNLGSQKNLGFRVSDGFCFGWFLCILTVFVFVGPVMPHAQIWYCRAWGSLWWFGEVVIFCLAMMRRDSERSRRFSSVFCLFCLLLKCGGELQALAMPICIAGPKVGGVSGPTSCTCFLPQEEEGFGGLIFHSSCATRLCICYSRSYIFWGSWRYRLPSFLMCFWCLRNVSVAYALRIHGSSCPEVPAYTTFQAWSWDNFLPWTNQFETNQIPKRVMRNHGRTWVSEYGSQDLDWAFFVDLDASTNAFRGRHKCSSTMLSTSCRGGPSEPLDRWRMHRTPNVALGAEPVGPSRPIANELGKEAARWKPPCLLHDGTVVQQLNIEAFIFFWYSLRTIEYMIFDARLQMEELRVLSKFQWVASFTVPQCHSATCIAAVSQSFQQQRTYLFQLKKQPCSH